MSILYQEIFQTESGSEMSISEISEVWNAFFHAPVCSSTTAIFRILIGTILVLNGILLVPLTNDYFSASGIWPTRVWNKVKGQFRFSILSFLPETTGSFRFVLAIHVLASLCFLIGYQFRLSAIVVFLTLVSIHHRNIFILSSGDTLLRIFTFLSIFSEANAALSIDAMLAGQGGLDFPEIPPWPIRLIQLQICTVYLRTVYWKLKGRSWRNGTAAWYPLWVEAYVRFRPPAWMLKPALIRIATWGTLIVEFCLAFLIWIREFRYPVLTTGVLMHLIFDLILNLQFFSWIMISGLILFVSPDDMATLLQSAAALVFANGR